jgi:quinol monooxygenase YgiN
MYVIIARWRIQPDHVAAVHALIAGMAVHARAEPGCRQYTLNHAVDDPAVVVIYEQYDDEAAFQAHIATEPFQRIVVGQIVPLLAERSREVMRTFGD